MTSGHRIILAAGGTGGHIFPAVAVAELFLTRGHTVSLFTDRRGITLETTPKEIAVHRIYASGMRGGILAKAGGIISLGTGVLQALRLFSKFRPKCVIGFGGYPSAPTMIAATLRKLPSAIHEQNAVIGRANRLVAGRVSIIATSFADTIGLPAQAATRAVVTGNPVRAGFSEVRNRKYPEIGTPGTNTRILVLGGSQGAKVFSDVVPKAFAAMPAILRHRFDIMQQCRPEDIERVRDTYQGAEMSPELSTFFDDVPVRMAAAHIVITRSGASTVAELAEAGRPAILIPYQHATDDHQTANAQAIDDGGAGWLLPHDRFTPEILTNHLKRLINQPDIAVTAADAAHRLGGLNAAAAVVDEVERLIAPHLSRSSGPGAKLTGRCVT